MTLAQQGFRFVLRTNEQGRLDSKWVHPAEVRPSDLDCTDMDDDTFHRTYDFWREHAQPTGEQS